MKQDLRERKDKEKSLDGKADEHIVQSVSLRWWVHLPACPCVYVCVCVSGRPRGIVRAGRGACGCGLLVRAPYCVRCAGITVLLCVSVLCPELVGKSCAYNCACVYALCGGVCLYV